MRWLTDFYFAEGPGIPKDAPKKKGLALIVDTVWREGFDLMKLNLIFVLFALPLVTLPAAFAALMRVTLTIAEDRNVYLFRDFAGAFRRYFVKATLAGLLVSVAISIPAYAAYVYFYLAATSLLMTPAFVLAASVSLLMAIAGTYFFAFMVTVDMPLKTRIALSLRAALGRPLPVLAALVFIAFLWLVHILLYPVSVLMPAVVNFSFGALAIAFSVLESVKNLPGYRQSPVQEEWEAISGV